MEIVRDAESQNSEGVFGLLEVRTRGIQWNFPGTDLILRNLRLIYGVGVATEASLRETGYRTIPDLLRHPRWNRQAGEILRAVSKSDVDRLACYGASDVELLSFYRPETVRFIDIETTGLYHLQPVFLVGILYFENGQGCIRQLLARNYAEERAILKETVDELKAACVIASFNGRSFDLPYLKSRLNYHRLDAIAQNWHLDLLRSTRRNYRDRVPNCRLVTIEKHILGEEREDDLPGALVPEFYQRFLDSNDRRYIDPILRHNACDLLSMAKLLHLLTNKKTEVGRQESESTG